MTQRDFMELVKRKRLSLMLSQKEIAKSIPISKSAYSKLENHLQSPSFFVIRRLAELFDIDLNIIKEQTKDYIYYD